ncbi:MAG: hypothetical protein N3D82_02210 [Ignisphaera sp.]|nr:hypothetical protein [Ignisphaera sp.]MCX8167831.1 hypothetical protein [Ignisphaera sp.]MDW8085804.1 hypothetical protein [Ignisphaera sp.]
MAKIPYITIGGALLLIAFLIPFLIVIRVLDSSIIVLIVAYVVSIIGLVLGIYGVAEKYSKRFRGPNSYSYW